MDREGARAFLWSDGQRFVALWAAEGQALARAPKARGDQLKMQAYRKAVQRYRREGHELIPCFEAPSQPLSVAEVASLLKTKAVSWERFNVWKYYGIGAQSGDDKACLFELQERIPADSPHIMKLYRALKANLSPDAWYEMLPLLPPDIDVRLEKDRQVRKAARPLLLLGCGLSLVLVIGGLVGLVRYIVR